MWTYRTHVFEVFEKSTVCESWKLRKRKKLVSHNPQHFGSVLVFAHLHLFNYIVVYLYWGNEQIAISQSDTTIINIIHLTSPERRNVQRKNDKTITHRICNSHGESREVTRPRTAQAFPSDVSPTLSARPNRPKISWARQTLRSNSESASRPGQ